MNLQGKRVLVTGGAGFMGSHLVDRLVREGCRVRVLTNYKSQPSIGNLTFLEPQVRDQVEVVWGDICDRDSVMHAVEGMSAVFHLAALIGIPYSYIAPSSYVQTNVGGTLNVLQAARAHNVERVVHTSTSEAYGSAQYTPIDEKHPLVGQSPYSATKIGADKLAESYYCSFELPVVIVRPFNLFGPGQSERAIIPTIIAQRVAGMNPITIGDPKPKRDFNFAPDTADGYVRAACCDAAIGKTINIGTGKSISIGELATRVCELTGGGEYVTDPARVRPSKSEVVELRCDSTLAHDLLGWQPKVGLEQGLKQTIEFVQSHQELFTPGTYRV